MQTNVKQNFSLYESYLRFIKNNCPKFKNLKQLDGEEQLQEAIELLFAGNKEKLKKTLLEAHKSPKLDGLREIPIILYICQIRYLKTHCRGNVERLAQAQLFRKLHYERNF